MGGFLIHVCVLSSLIKQCNKHKWKLEEKTLERVGFEMVTSVIKITGVN